MRFKIIPVTDYQQNCSLIVCEQTNLAALIDPGGDIDLLQAEIKHQQVEISSILLTHGHFDHIGGVAELANRLRIPVIGPHQDDGFLIEALPEQCRMFGFPASAAFQPNRWLQDGDQVEVGEIKLQVLHCPGHSPGHVAYYNPELKLAWVGDILFKGSIGRTDLPRGDYQTLIDSIVQKLWPLGSDIRFVPGHGPMSSFGDEMRNNPYVKLNALQ